MSPERLEQIEMLYNDALALQPQDRSAFLDRACGEIDISRIGSFRAMRRPLEITPITRFQLLPLSGVQ